MDVLADAKSLLERAFGDNDDWLIPVKVDFEYEGTVKFSAYWDAGSGCWRVNLVEEER